MVISSSPFVANSSIWSKAIAGPGRGRQSHPGDCPRRLLATAACASLRPCRPPQFLAPCHPTAICCAMPERHHTRILIIGAGPAGYTAAIYAARANMNPILVAGMQPGGQLTITTDVENYPGFADVIQGPWLMEQMEAQARHVGTMIRHDIVTEVDFSHRPFRCLGDSGDSYTADAVIIATGAQGR